ncbi:MAG: PAS domain S-box protein, partial [Pirellulaceae bacterium]
MAQPLSSLTSSSPVTPGVVRGMVVRCLLALVILTTVAIGGYVLDRRQTRLVRDQVELLAQDGRERMLANRVESLLREDALLALVMLTVTLSVIGFTGLAVFRPMIREVRLETENYVAANQALDQRAAELAATLEELEKERDERRLQLQEMAGMMHDLEEERGKLEREIQARQVVQEALEASEQRSFAIIESAPIAMMVTNGSGQIVMTNVRAEELFGYDREEILGQAVETVLVQRSGRSEANAASRRAGAPAEPAADAGLYGVAKDGRLFPVDVGTNPLEMEEGDYLLSAIVD